MKFSILSLFPEYFRGPFSESMLQRAQTAGLLTIELKNIRDWAKGTHKKVDDRPYGGGPGMVLMVDPVVQAIRATRTPDAKVIYMSPQGKLLTAKRCRELAVESHIVILCGHYEGVDERALAEVDEEISIGDYVITNGCLAACVCVDAISRFIPGVVGDPQGVLEDSFENGLLDWPQYTRPEEFEGRKVPEVLLSGNHKLIAEFREGKAREKTKMMRPDLYDENYLGDNHE